MLIRVFLKLRTWRLSLMVGKLKSVEFSLAFCGASCYANKNRNEKFSWKRGERLSKHAFAGGMFSPFSLKCDNRLCETEGFTFSEGHSAVVGTGIQALQGHAFHTILHCMHQWYFTRCWASSAATGMWNPAWMRACWSYWRERGNVIRAKNHTTLTFPRNDFIVLLALLWGRGGFFHCFHYCLLIGGGRRSMHT